MDSISSYLDWIEGKAEGLLEKRARRIERRKLREKQKGQIREWAEAILWAVFWVLLINQFIFQLYQIPSSSMEDTLKIGDRLFVNKMVYGPELYPGGPKFLDDTNPERYEVFIFENPAYVSRGPAFDILNRVVYMLTLSLVNLDRHEDGTPRAQLYVKRAAAVEGERAAFRQGELYVHPRGFSEPIAETELRQLSGGSFSSKRLLDDNDYLRFSLSARSNAYEYAGLTLSSEDQQTAGGLSGRPPLVDYYEMTRLQHYELLTLHPDQQSARNEFYRMEQGYYIPEGYIFPIGDNRDNSIDGRYFGPVTHDRVLGKANVIFWPFSRAGVIR